MYYYVFSYSGLNIKRLRDSSEEEYMRITGLTKSIVEFITDAKKVDIIVKTYDGLQKTVSSFLGEDGSVSGRDISYSLSDYLFRARKYLDNWETHINRQYGKDSSFFIKFKACTAYEYDNNIEYRIMYQLRNFDQHCDNIISSITIGLNENGEKYLNVNLSTDKLLNEYKKWKSREKEDLASLEKTIDALVFVDKYHKCILNIHQQTCAYHFNRELYMNCAELLKCANEFGQERETLQFVKQENVIDKLFWQQSTKTLNFTSWCIPEAYDLLIQHLKNNMASIKVVYCGNQYKALLKDAALEIDESILGGLANNIFIKDGDKQYIRGYANISLDNCEGWAILLDSRFGTKEIRDFTSDIKDYVSTILME